MADYQVEQERPAPTTTTVIERRSGGGGTTLAILLLVIVVAVAAFFLISSETNKDNAVSSAASKSGLSGTWAHGSSSRSSAETRPIVKALQRVQAGPARGISTGRSGRRRPTPPGPWRPRSNTPRDSQSARRRRLARLN